MLATACSVAAHPVMSRASFVFVPFDNRHVVIILPVSDIRSHAGWLWHSLFGLEKSMTETTVFPKLDLGAAPICCCKRLTRSRSAALDHARLINAIMNQSSNPRDVGAERQALVAVIRQRLGRIHQFCVARSTCNA